MAVMAIIAVLLSYVAPRYFSTVARAEEATLRNNLFQIRDAVDKFYGDHGRYPGGLAELVKLRYLREIPVDPMTRRNDTWQIVTLTGSSSGGVFDVRSTAPGRALDGSAYASW